MDFNFIFMILICQSIADTSNFDVNLLKKICVFFPFSKKMHANYPNEHLKLGDTNNAEEFQTASFSVR